MRRKTPQEKKKYSYAKDRRNAYGENDKSSRKNIPRRKKAPHRANRRRAGQILETITGAVDESAEEGAEVRLLSRRPKSWKKLRDAPLGEIVQNRLERRIQLGIEDRVRGAKRIRQVRKRLHKPSAPERFTGVHIEVG